MEYTSIKKLLTKDSVFSIKTFSNLNILANGSPINGINAITAQSNLKNRENKLLVVPVILLLILRIACGK